MSFISAAAHQKFISQCKTIVETTFFDNGRAIPFDDKKDKLKNDVQELQQLMDAYDAMLLELPKLTCRYYNLHRRIRINMRKLQLKKSRSIRKNLGSK